MKASLSDLLSKIPGAPSEQWPGGARYALAFSHGSMSVGYYVPVGADLQKPHKRDEIYIIHKGTGELLIAGKRNNFMPGDAFFVGAGVEHQFENFTPDFATWIVFWGPLGGEREL
ncbi:MAG: cupin domain-containing protein [Gammaproteobacteria bacterium]